MTAREKGTRTEAPAAYSTPTLKRFGSATELTKQRTMNGAMDGGANNSRSQ